MSPALHGQRHPRSRASDALVIRARELREVHHWTYGQIAQTLGVLRSVVQKWCCYQRRRLPRPEDFQ